MTGEKKRSESQKHEDEAYWKRMETVYGETEREKRVIIIKVMTRKIVSTTKN